VSQAPVRPRAAPAPPRPRHLRVVPPPGRGGPAGARRTRLVFAAALAAATAVALALVYFHVVLAQRQFALDRLDQQVANASAAYQQERLQVAQLGSPAAVIATAEGRLGMAAPATITYLTPDPAAPAAPVPSTGVAPLGQTGSATLPPAAAPAGDADWPRIKSSLAGSP
jgi:cell division protein FtsB